MKKRGKSNISTDITFRKFRLVDLNLAQYNPRQISKENFAGLKSSLEKFGLVEPIIVNIRDDRNIIVGGHQRYKVLVSAGIDTATCVMVDCCDVDERLLNITLNNPATQGEFIVRLDAYIDLLKSELPEGTELLDLRINGR